jgi:hypothetical protein
MRYSILLQKTIWIVAILAIFCYIRCKPSPGGWFEVRNRKEIEIIEDN